MPDLIPTPCRAFGCGKPTADGYCPRHAHLKRDRRRMYGRNCDRRRPSPSRRGYNRQWVKARELYLGDNPLCVRCMEKGWVVSATVVDHIEPHRGDMARFWDRGNWQALCKRCHDRKTASEDRGESWY